jgi:predicted transposase/invertase (TIGR01784 family)
MPKPYDDAMKKLVAGNPQDFLSWVLREALYGQQLPYELRLENIYADGLIEATLNGKKMLVHFEFQSGYDLRIGERLLEYNVLASRQYGYLPVSSWVIYLKDCGNVPQSPFVRESPIGEEVVRFYYGCIELHKVTAEELIQTDLVGLSALLPLTRDGARREVIEKMVTRLVEAERTESLWIGYALAAKALTNDLKWLKWRFAMLGDFLRDSPVYQEVLEEGMEKGREEGLRTQRRTLLEIIQERFPELAFLAKKQAEAINDPEVLSRLTVKISIVSTSREAEQYLLTSVSDNNKN